MFTWLWFWRDHIGQLRQRGKLEVRAPGAIPGPLSPTEWLVVLSVSLGVGLVPLAPATLASAATVAAAYLLRGAMSPEKWLAVVVAVFLAGWLLGEPAERILRCKDPRSFILDEVAGQLLVFVFVPITAPTALLGFLLFRVFDVLKMPPGDALDRQSGGWAIMADDVVAGLYAGAGIFLLRRAAAILA